MPALPKVCQIAMFSCVIVSSPDNRPNLLRFTFRPRKLRSVIDSLSPPKTSKRARNDLQLTGFLPPDFGVFHPFKILLDITSETRDLFSCVTLTRTASYPVNPPLPTGHGRALINRQSSSGSYQNPHGGRWSSTLCHCAAE